MPSGLTSQWWQLHCVIRQSTSFLSNCQKCFLHNNLQIIFYIFYPLTLINLLSSCRRKSNPSLMWQHAKMWPQSLLWQFLCFLTRSSSKSLFSATLIALLQNLSSQTVYLFSPTRSLFPHCHLIYIGFDLILGFSSPQFHEFKKKVRKLLFNYLFQKVFILWAGLGVWEGGSGGKGCMYSYRWFTSYSRKQHNLVKQLPSN